MLRRLILVLPLLWSAATFAAEVTDSTGRAVQVPDQISHVLPAGPPAAILLEAIAPELMVGWPGAVSPDTLALLPDAANHPRIPRLTGRDDVSDKIKALKPDVILDYGEVTPRYFELAQATQQKTGIPTLLFAGPLDKIPLIVRQVGALLHREARAETIATYAEAMLALPEAQGNGRKVVYARGADGLLVTGPDTDVTEVFTPAWLAGDRARRAGQRFVRPASTRSARLIRMSSYFPTRRCPRRSNTTTPGKPCARCVRATSGSPPRFRSAGLRNRHR